MRPALGRPVGEGTNPSSPYSVPLGELDAQEENGRESAAHQF